MKKTRENYFKKEKNLQTIIRLQKIVIKNRFQKKRRILNYYNTPEKLNNIIFLQQFFIKRYFDFFRPLMLCIILKYFSDELKMKIDINNLDNIDTKNLYCIYSYVFYQKEGMFLFDYKPELKKEINR